MFNNLRIGTRLSLAFGLLIVPLLANAAFRLYEASRMHLAASRQDQTMVAAICTVARSMGLRTVAEFVEDAATIDILRNNGVDAVQGYSVGHPEPLLSALADLSLPPDL
jgi:predicted signal transduction protein with EAL and GGDEF domain